MSHFTRVRINQTAWQSGAVLDSEFEKLDAQSFAALNGDAGGVWAPTSPIVIGGQGMTLTAILQAQGGLIVYNGTLINGALSVSGGDLTVLTGQIHGELGAHIEGAPFTVDSASTFNSTADFFGNVTVHSAALFGAAGNVNIGIDATKNMNVSATATFNAQVDFGAATTVHSGGSFTVLGNTQLGASPANTLNVSATTDFSGPVTFDGNATFNQQADFWANLVVHTSGSLNVNGPTLLNGNVTLGDSTSDIIDIPGQVTIHKALQYTFQGRVPLRPLMGPDANATFKTSDANLVYADAVSTTRTYTLLDDGAVDGDEMIVVSGSNAASLRVATPAGTNYEVRAAVAGVPVRCHLVRIQGTWKAVELPS